MKNHLTAKEVQILLDKNYHNNQEDLVSHLDSCEECKKLFDDQREMHQLLLTVKPQQAPLHLKETIFHKVYQTGVNNQLKWLITFGVVTVLAIISLIVFGLAYMQPVQPAAQTIESGSYVKDGIQSMYNYITLGLGWLLNHIDMVVDGINKTLNNGLLLLSIFLLGLIFYLWDWIYQIRISKPLQKN